MAATNVFGNVLTWAIFPAPSILGQEEGFYVLNPINPKPGLYSFASLPYWVIEDNFRKFLMPENWGTDSSFWVLGAYGTGGKVALSRVLQDFLPQIIGLMSILFYCL